MVCIIIEDENKAAQNLKAQLQRLPKPVAVDAIIDSVEEAVQWLQNNKTDLIFMDVQLGDGIAFEIFDHVQVRTPIIFTTSHDHYITKAFEVNSISYLLKPLIFEGLALAMEKYYFLYEKEEVQNDKLIQFNEDFQKRFIVKKGRNMQSIILESEIAWFHVVNKHYLFIVTRNNQQYLYDSTLEILEKRLDPRSFFRINRHCIMGLESVKQVVNINDNSRRIKIETIVESKEEMIVSRHRVTEFKSWINI
jgi:two-component system response regulator LytT